MALPAGQAVLQSWVHKESVWGWSKEAVLPWDQDASNSSVKEDAAARFWAAVASFQLQW